MTTMILRRGSLALLLVVLAATASSVYGAGRPITVDDLLAMHRISDPQLSPDGGRVLYTVGVPDLAANRVARTIWVVPTAGGEPRALTTSGRDGEARWSPDGTRIAYVSTDGGSAQLWLMNADGSAKKAVTKISGGVDQIVWAPDGRSIAFASEVYVDCKDDACNAARDKALEESKVQAHVTERTLYRHWSSWVETKRNHLFVVAAEGGTPRDLTAGADYDVPPRQREGAHPIAFSPDSRTLCFTAVVEPLEAISTNADLFEVDVTGSAPRKLTTNPGFDGAPAYSPDGKSIAYHAQSRNGYEADRWRLMILDRATGKTTNVAEAFDRSVDNPVWSADGRSIYFNAEDRGELPVFSVPASGGAPRALTANAFDGEFTVAGRAIVVARSSLASPVELWALGTDGSAPKQLTHVNRDRLAALDLAKPESFTFKGAGGTDVQGFLVRPPAFDPSKKYPVLMVLHGGPQTQHSDTWSYRWNPQVFASHGYVALMINRRGSTGFGQQFTDDITGDWGGKAFDDLMNGLDYALGKYPFTDRDRVAAAGGSYGGYMIDWMASHSKGRFRALISHAGVYDLTSSYATEELWFPEHDYKGAPWENPELYAKMSPHTYAAEFGKYKTPTLVIAGELDYRVPYTQSLEFYNTLQRQGVPSKLIVFPDEGHWVLKPRNSKFWYGQFLDWLDKYLGAASPDARKSVQ